MSLLSLLIIWVHPYWIKVLRKPEPTLLTCTVQIDLSYRLSHWAFVHHSGRTLDAGPFRFFSIVIKSSSPLNEMIWWSQGSRCSPLRSRGASPVDTGAMIMNIWYAVLTWADEQLLCDGLGVGVCFLNWQRQVYVMSLSRFPQLSHHLPPDVLEGHLRDESWSAGS